MRSFLLIAIVLLVCGCAVFGGGNHRSVQVRTYKNVDYDKLFQAFKKVIQWEGYQIKTEDLPGGLLTGSIHRPDAEASLALDLGGIKKKYQGDLFELSANFLRVSPKVVQIRVSLQKISHSSLGSDQGEEIQDVRFYKEIYNKVKLALRSQLPEQKIDGNKAQAEISSQKIIPAAVLKPATPGQPKPN